MAGQSVRILDAQTLTASKSSPREQILDLGAYQQLNVHRRILKAGTAGTIVLQDAAVNEDDAFRDIPTMSWTLDSTSNSGVEESSSFLRFVRWKTDASVASSPVAIIDIVAKE